MISPDAERTQLERDQQSSNEYEGLPPNNSAGSQYVLLSVNRNYEGKLARNSPHWSHHTKSFEPATLNVGGIADVIQTGYSITALIRDKRDAGNFIASQLIGLDFDTDDERSSFDNLLRHPFIAEYACLLHTTSSHTESKPRAHVFFMLDKPVTDSQEYARYATALNTEFEITDGQCTDAARCWFGAVDCEISERAGHLLPLQVLRLLVAKHSTGSAVRETVLVYSGGDLDKLILCAISEAVPGTRNIVGFRLACHLRDAGVPQQDAYTWMRKYQIAVEDMGDHPYIWAEARESLISAYSQPPRRQYLSGLELDNALRLFDWVIWQGYGLQSNAKHSCLQTAMAIDDIARKTHRLSELDLPVRGFDEYGINKTTADGHLHMMQNASTIVQEVASDGTAGTRYRINMPFLYELWNTVRMMLVPESDKHAVESVIRIVCPGLAPPYDFVIQQCEVFKSLQRLSHFRHGSHIDPRLSVTKPPEECFGPAAQRLIATLDVCELESMTQWYKLARVPKRTAKRKTRLLEEIGIVRHEVDTTNESVHIPYLVDNWYEQLVEFEPAMSTYGRDVLHAIRNAEDQIRYHTWCLEHKRTSTQEQETRESVISSARNRLEVLQASRTDLQETRRNYASNLGITSEVLLGSSVRR